MNRPEEIARDMESSIRILLTTYENDEDDISEQDIGIPEGKFPRNVSKFILEKTLEIVNEALHEGTLRGLKEAEKLVNEPSR
jgi:hypothetical protein